MPGDAGTKPVVTESLGRLGFIAITRNTDGESMEAARCVEALLQRDYHSVPRLSDLLT